MDIACTCHGHMSKTACLFCLYYFNGTFFKLQIPHISHSQAYTLCRTIGCKEHDTAYFIILLGKLFPKHALSGGRRKFERSRAQLPDRSVKGNVSQFSHRFRTGIGIVKSPYDQFVLFTAHDQFDRGKCPLHCIIRYFPSQIIINNGPAVFSPGVVIHPE